MSSGFAGGLSLGCPGVLSTLPSALLSGSPVLCIAVTVQTGQELHGASLGEATQQTQEGWNAQSWSLKSLGALADHSLMVLTVLFL